MWFWLVLLFLLLFCQNVMCKYMTCVCVCVWMGVVHIANNMHLGYANPPMPYKRKSNLNAFLVYLFSFPPLSFSHHFSRSACNVVALFRCIVLYFIRLKLTHGIHKCKAHYTVFQTEGRQVFCWKIYWFQI